MTVSSSKFFAAVCGKDYDKLIHIYGSASIEALQNYQNVHMRWNSRDRNLQFSTYKAEEKFEESLSNPFVAGYLPSRGDSENKTPLNTATGGNFHGRSSNRIAESGDLIREFTNFLLHPECNYMELESFIQLPQSSSSAASREWDAGQVVYDAVCSLTEIRPPSDFAIYPDGIIVQNSDNDSAIRSTTGYVGGGGSMVSIENLTIDPHRTVPPIFDGAVANATPNFGTNGGSGIGTALHAVAALDHPLTMALLLAMGADTRASHTAFRRLVHHEAACNGSIRCLTLLLELGNRFGEEIFTRNGSLSLNQSTINEKVPSTGSPASTLDYPFHRQSNAAAGNLSSLRSKDMKLWKNLANHCSSQTDVLLLLRLFHSLVKEVEKGSMLELDAARILVQRATLSDETKVALAIQCGYRFENDYDGITNSSSRQTPNETSSDGHGNTPLHWAAFKNETACISLLLKYRADPNARAHPSGWTPLHDAAYSNGRDAIALLIDAGAIVDAKASSGATPLCFAAQEDAAEAVELLLIRGAEVGTRCSPDSIYNPAPNERQSLPQTRFSGYTPLHYCAHYNACNAAKLLLQHHTALAATEIRDLNGRLPIHIAAARGSSSVLRALLVAGARVENRALSRHYSVSSASPPRRQNYRNRSQNSANVPDNILGTEIARSAPSTPRNRIATDESGEGTLSTTDLTMTPPRALSCRGSSVLTAPVSSPLLRSMIPSQPIQSSKPWNCLTQRSIDECRQLISEVEQNWTPDRHSLFTPADRRAVAALLRVGKRLESEGALSFTYLWPEVLSFCGRGWFEVEEDDTETTDIECLENATDSEKEHLALPTFC